ncbi:MAG: hypothetical protein KAS70_00755 [Planctomycetes bacterium]|nr:hypothetical protein [Planctomycetota bacterium]
MTPPLKHNGKGITSTVIGSISIVLFLLILNIFYLLYSSGQLQKSTLLNILTLLVIFDLLLVTYGFVLGIKGLFDPLRKKTFSIIGTVLNSILLAVFLTIVSIGLFRYFSR